VLSTTTMVELTILWSTPSVVGKYRLSLNLILGILVQTKNTSDLSVFCFNSYGFISME